ncbi:MAG TPA: FlgD immunoglobulin-like domain containing protein [Candidatus Latescibacteria bacterium]|nr:FlgD immunoglobulin-like domain containing protein [Candidatus Latescibacterota bacterium]HOS65961.1 FlgD immunoglobulin-like domain containing protein [Candidatus Latescibacterota bacterium]HPK75947.1 FlgD immunoglobulin-like domain containing protein [Candidatus Latescibacterota bacterium]
MCAKTLRTAIWAAVLGTPFLARAAEPTFSIPHNPFYGQTQSVWVSYLTPAHFRVQGIVADIVSTTAVKNIKAAADLQLSQLETAYVQECNRIRQTGGSGTMSTINAALQQAAANYTAARNQVLATQARDTETAIRKFTNWYVNGVYQETDASSAANGYADPLFTAVFYRNSIIQAQVLDGTFKVITTQAWIVQVQPVSVEEVAAVAPFALFQNAPNPFNPSTTIRFSLPDAGYVKLAVYDVTGALVRTLVEGPVETGIHEAVWDGKNTLGAEVASGMYVYRLTGGCGVLTRRMTLLR